MSPANIRESGVEIFNSLGVTEVLWIDDFFHKEGERDDREAIINDLKEEVNDILDAGEFDRLFELNVLPESCVTYPEPVKKKIAIKRIEEEEVDLVTLAKDLLGRDVNLKEESGAANQDDKGEMAPEQFEATLDVLGELATSVRTLSFTEWFDDRDKIAVNKETLIFVDLRSNEPDFSGEVGIGVIEHYSNCLSKDNLPIFVVLTFECSEYDEEEKREFIFSRIKDSGVDGDFFQVMAKSRLSGSGDIDRHVVVNIKRLFLRKVSFGISGFLIKDVIDAIGSAKDNILRQGIYDISDVIFESSHNEGVSEVEVFHRLFSITQRLAIYQALKKYPSIVDNLVALRRINKSIKDDFKSDKPNEFFSRLRWSEVFLSSDDINNTYDPLAPGDIFEFSYKTTGRKKKNKSQEYVLITQPCDMVLRSDNGRRKTNVGVLVPVKREKIDSEGFFEKKGAPAYHEYFVDKNSKEVLFAELNSGLHVNLNVLDWCSFNYDGRVVFCSNSERPALVHLDGHVKRFDELLLLAQSTKDEENNRFPRIFSLDRPVFEAETAKFMLPDYVVEKVEPDHTVFSVPMRRVGRLQSIYFEHLLRSYFSYRARQAFDHDFA